MSLAGRHILVTRPVAQAAALMQLLEAEAAVPVAFPLIDIQADEAALARLATEAASADWLVFVSPTAIDLAWPRLASAKLAPLPRLATVGHASGQRLAERSGQTVLYPEGGDDSAALAALPALQAMAGQRVLIVRGHGGRPELGQTLAARGACVRFAEVYRRADAAPDWARFDALAARGALDAAVITSGPMAQALYRLGGSARMPTLQCLTYCVPHPRIAQALHGLGATQVVTTRADDKALVAGLKEWFLRHP